jgi:hypothetical protein
MRVLAEFCTGGKREGNWRDHSSNFPTNHRKPDFIDPTEQRYGNLSGLRTAPPSQAETTLARRSGPIDTPA